MIGYFQPQEVSILQPDSFEQTGPHRLKPQRIATRLDSLGKQNREKLLAVLEY
jgi:hypothetical protein